MRSQDIRELNQTPHALQRAHGVGDPRHRPADGGGQMYARWMRGGLKLSCNLPVSTWIAGLGGFGPLLAAWPRR